MQLLKRHPILLTISGLLILYATYTINLNTVNPPLNSNPSNNTVQTPSHPVKLQIKRKDLLRYFNQERRKRGISVVSEAPILDSLSKRKAIDLSEHNLYSHTDSMGRRGSEVIRQIVGCYQAAELLDETTNSKDAIKQWMHSPEHRQALLDPVYKTVGFGSAKDRNGYYLVIASLCS